MREPCKKCGSAELWCDCCLGCGGLHMFRDCPGHDIQVTEPPVPTVVMAESVKDLKSFCDSWQAAHDKVHAEHNAGILGPNTKVELEPMPIPTFRVLSESGMREFNEISEKKFDRIQKEMQMEKRGVVLDDSKTKTASKEKKCPKCSTPTHESGYCSNCGTEPYEKEGESNGGE